MTRIYTLAALILAVLFVVHPALAIDKKELRKQQQIAQKERQVQKKERTDQNRAGLRAFREFVSAQRAEYRENVADLTMEFQLQEVDLKAAHETNIAASQAEYQKKVTGLFLTPGMKLDQVTIKKHQNDAKAYADELFTLKKQSAEKMHQAWIANENRKNELLTERDRNALTEADTLGLTKDYPPILATKIGDGLTRAEERWNESEKKNVARIKEKNLKSLAKYRNGERLRNLELQHANEDFKLSWDKKAELHALDSRQVFYSALLMQPNQGSFDQQAFLADLAEDGKKKNLITIKYKKLSNRNRIIRRKEKKDILNK